MECSRINSQVTHSLLDANGDPLRSGAEYDMVLPRARMQRVRISEDELNFDLWWIPLPSGPADRPQRVDELASDVALRPVLKA